MATTQSLCAYRDLEREAERSVERIERTDIMSGVPFRERVYILALSAYYKIESGWKTEFWINRLNYGWNTVPAGRILKKMSKSAMSTLKRLFELSACGFHNRK